ncbi:hypothetical protein [Cupriavidus plantarum]|nr:hypothetical protein [Cupriavidus plantarum]
MLFATRKGELMIADGANGTIDAHPLSGRRTYGITLSQRPSRILLGAYSDWAVVEHTRTPEGIQAAAVRQLPIDRGTGVSIPQENVLLMRGGTLLAFPWQSDIGWVDLKTGAAGRWRISPYFDTAFAQTDDTHLLLTSNDPKGRATWSFDIDAQTVTPVESLPSAVYLRRVGQRHGYLLRSRDAWIGDEVTSKGEAADLHKTVADYALQLQLNRLQQLIDAEKAAAAAPVSSAAFGTASLRGTTGNGGVTSATNPALANVSADAQVHMVGVYEGKRDARSLATPGVSSARERRDVRVIVPPAPRPVVLVLSSYEPVNWVVENRGAQLAAVLLSGYHPSSVTGASAVPLLRIGSAYAYANGGGGYEALRRSVVQYTGTREIRSFQGTYMGSEFVVGG